MQFASFRFCFSDSSNLPTIHTACAASRSNDLLKQKEKGKEEKLWSRHKIYSSFVRALRRHVHDESERTI